MQGKREQEILEFKPNLDRRRQGKQEREIVEFEPNLNKSRQGKQERELLKSRTPFSVIRRDAKCPGATLKIYFYLQLYF